MLNWFRYLQYGSAAYESENYNKALIHLKNGLSLYNHYLLHYQIAFTYLQLKQLGLAEKHIRAYYELAPSTYKRDFDLGLILYGCKKYDGAMFHFKKTIEANSKHAVSYYYLGEIYFNCQAYDDAAIQWQEAIKLGHVVISTILTKLANHLNSKVIENTYHYGLTKKIPDKIANLKAVGKLSDKEYYLLEDSYQKQNQTDFVQTLISIYQNRINIFFSNLIAEKDDDINLSPNANELVKPPFYYPFIIEDICNLILRAESWSTPWALFFCALTNEAKSSLGLSIPSAHILSLQLKLNNPTFIKDLVFLPRKIFQDFCLIQLIFDDFGWDYLLLFRNLHNKLCSDNLLNYFNLIHMIQTQVELYKNSKFISSLFKEDDIQQFLSLPENRDLYHAALVTAGEYILGIGESILKSAKDVISENNDHNFQNVKKSYQYNELKIVTTSNTLLKGNIHLLAERTAKEVMNEFHSYFHKAKISSALLPYMANQFEMQHNVMPHNNKVLKLKQSAIRNKRFLNSIDDPRKILHAKVNQRELEDKNKLEQALKNLDDDYQIANHGLEKDQVDIQVKLDNLNKSYLNNLTELEKNGEVAHTLIDIANPITIRIGVSASLSGGLSNATLYMPLDLQRPIFNEPALTLSHDLQSSKTGIHATFFQKNNNNPLSNPIIKEPQQMTIPISSFINN